MDSSWQRYYRDGSVNASVKQEAFDPRNMVVFGWAGMRGVVSMAAALALPLLLPGGAAFPHRNLIIYLSFCVILSTLGFTWIYTSMDDTQAKA